MTHKETKTETKDIIIVVKEWTTCDICKNEVIEGPFDIHVGEASLKVGSSYPECGSLTETKVDICKDCFTNKLIPWLISQDADIQTMERDW